MPQLTRAMLMSFVCVLAGATAWTGALPPPLPPLPTPAPTPTELKPVASRMTFQFTEHNFGTIFDSQPQQVVFPFTNTGRDPLIIGEVKSTCGCTVPELTKKTYLPGESGEITINYNPKGKRGNDSRSVTIQTNDSTQPTVRLTIKAHVQQLVILEPTMLQFGQVDKGKSKQMELFVGGRTDDFKVSLATSNMPDVYTIEVGDTEVRQIGPDKENLRATRLIVTLRDDAPVGMHTAELTIRTNDPRRPIERTQLLCQVLGDIAVVPPRLSLGRIQPGDQFSREFRVQSRSGEPFKITQVEVRDSTSNLKFEFAPEDPKNPTVWNVKVTGSAQPNERRILGQILIRTDVKGEELLEVRYNGFINPR